jgi:hypothetical protein
MGTDIDCGEDSTEEGQDKADGEKNGILMLCD